MKSNRLSLAAACSGYFFVLLDVTIVSVVLAHIAGDLGSDRAGLQWVADAYALVLATLMLSTGNLADLYGRRRVFSVGLAGFGLASLLCALAPSVGALVVGRVLQGLAAAAILPTSLAIVGHAFPGSGERARAIGFWAGIGSLALIAGPILGGVLVDALGWRAIFLLNVPLSAAALALTRLAVEARARDLDRGDRRGWCRRVRPRRPGHLRPGLGVGVLPQPPGRFGGARAQAAGAPGEPRSGGAQRLDLAARRSTAAKPARSSAAVRSAPRDSRSPGPACSSRVRAKMSASSLPVTAIAPRRPLSCGPVSGASTTGIEPHSV